VVELGRSQRPIPWELIAKALARKATVYHRSGDLARALELYEQAQTESSSAPVERKIRALRQELEAKAKADYVNPELGKAAKEEGNVAFKACDFRTAIELYSEAIKRDPTNAVYWTNRSTARCKLMDFGGGLEDVKRAIELDASYVKAFSRKARIEMFTKLYHKALDTVSEGLEKDPENVELRQVMSELDAKIQASMYAAPDPVRQERAMADPEIAGIMRDPMTQQAIRDLSSDPTAMSRIMSDPGMSRKINRLILAGVLSFGSPGAAGAEAE